MPTLNELKAAQDAKYNTLLDTINPNEELNQTDLDAISQAYDEINETWNENLTPRPPKS